MNMNEIKERRSRSPESFIVPSNKNELDEKCVFKIKIKKEADPDDDIIKKKGCFYHIFTCF